MLRDSATVDISRLGKTIQKLHKAEKEGQGKLKRKAFDLLKEHFKLRQFFKKLDEKLAQIEKQLALPITLEQFSSLKRELKDLQTESHLYQEIRFRLGKSYLNCQ